MTNQVQGEPSDFDRRPTTFPLKAYQRIYVLLNRGKVLDAYALLQEFDLEQEKQDQDFV